MFIKRFYYEPLAQASYMIGCHAAGMAVVVDANRDTAQYHEAARSENVRITHVTETHIHADYLSGSRQLARETGAQLLLSAEGGDAWQYAFAAGDGATLLRDGDSFAVGDVRIDVIHTPGHTPEHLTFLVTDLAAGDAVVGALTGDFIFVGDVGRPDLLERAAKVSGTMENSARDLFRSLQRFARQPDHLQLWPGHGAGSACGKALGAMPQSTLGYEKLVNWAFAIRSEDEFVKEVLAGQPSPPTYFATMKRLNRDGPAVLAGPPSPRMELPSELERAVAERRVLVDARRAAAFRRGHVPGALSIPLGRSFAGWAGWLLPYDRDLYLIVDGVGRNARADADRAALDLAMIGLDRVGGYFTSEALDDWEREHGGLEAVTDIDPASLSEKLRRGELRVVDVRAPSEWNAGHIPGSTNIPLGELANASRALADEGDGPVVLQCAGGSRSTIASSILLAGGNANVVNLDGGLEAWRSAGLPLAEEDGACD